MSGIASTPAPVTPAGAPLSTTAVAPPPTPPAPLRRRGRWRLRNARIRAKLALILLVPLMAIGALATARLVDAVGRAVEADQAHALATVAVAADDLGHELHRERIEAARLLSEPAGSGGRDPDHGRDPTDFTRQTARTDTAAAGYRDTASRLADVPAVAATRLAAIDAHLVELIGLRQQILSDPAMSLSAALLRYQAMLADLGAYQASLPAIVVDAGLSEQARAVAAIAAAAGHAADAESIARTAWITGTLTTAQREALRQTQTGQREAFVAFGQSATPTQRAIVDQAIAGANVEVAQEVIAALLDPTTTTPDPATATGLAGMADLTRYTAAQLYTDLLHTLAGTQARVLRQVVLESSAVIVVLVAAVLVAVLLARMLATALRRLRAAAVGVAHTDLPAVVARLADPQSLADTSPARLAGQIQVPDRLRTRDEIGEVAYALFDVHRTAVHIAAEQATLRTGLAALFVNLARRSQTLVDAMISRLDRLQRDETDADKLQQMMALDSLATRMRRNDENLLVLAGADSSPPRARDALVIDVLRAAQSEIEHYTRVEFGAVDDDVFVTAAAVNDTVRLIAELLDNATRFSRPDIPVVCEARRLGHQLVIQIEDRGVGMTPDTTHIINTLLAHPRHLDITAMRKMGLAVVARLAARHHIHVQLHAHPTDGTTATIALPPTVLTLPGRHHANPSRTPPTPPDAGATARARRSTDVARHHPGRRSDTTQPLPALNGHPWPPESATVTGLPKRVPQAQNPGTSHPPAPPPGAAPPRAVSGEALPAPRRPLEQTRDQLTAYQAGVQKARDRRPPDHHR